MSSIVRKSFDVPNVQKLLKLYGYTDVALNRNFPFPKVSPLDQVKTISRFDAKSKNGKVVLFIFIMDNGEVRFTGIGGRSNITNSTSFDKLIQFLGDNK